MTDQELVFEQLKKMKPQAIILFGSYAWGKPHRDSDLDILMIKDTKRSFRNRIWDVHTALKTNMPVDIIVLTSKEAEEAPRKSVFFKQIITEGKLIYGNL